MIFDVPGLTKMHCGREDTFFYYDGPKFFQAHGEDDNKYIVLFVGEDEYGDIYLVGQISEENLVAMREGSISIRKAIESCTKLFLYDGEDEAEETDFDRIPDYHLPEEEICLTDGHIDRSA